MMSCFKSIFSFKFNPKVSVCQGSLHSPTGPPFCAKSGDAPLSSLPQHLRSVPLSLPQHLTNICPSTYSFLSCLTSSPLLCPPPPPTIPVPLWVLAAASSLGCLLSPVSLSRSVQVPVPVEILIKLIPAGNVVPNDYGLKPDTSVHFLPNGYK